MRCCLKGESQDSPFLCLSHLARRNAVPLGEPPREVQRVGETDRQRDLRDSEVGRLQQLDGFPEPETTEPAERRKSRALLEEPREIAGFEPETVGELLRGDRVYVVIRHEEDRLVDVIAPDRGRVGRRKQLEQTVEQRGAGEFRAERLGRYRVEQRVDEPGQRLRVGNADDRIFLGYAGQSEIILEALGGDADPADRPDAAAGRG